MKLSSIPPHARLRVSAAQLSCDLGDEAVILDVESGKYFGLDEVGALVWCLAQDGGTVGGIRDAILGAFEVEAERCERDLQAFLEQLVDRGLFEVDDVGGA